MSCKKPYSEGVEFEFLCKNKKFKYLEFNAINLFQKEGIEGLILDCRDIMQRKKDSEELLRAQKAKEQFLANISHEIRTPINGIAGMATLLNKNPSAEEQITYLHAIKSAADNLKVIINDILDLASTESGKLKFEKIGFSLSDLLASLIDIFSVQAKEKGIELKYVLHPDADQVLIGDPVRLNQILINLISNAIKFTHVGSILIHVAIEKKEKTKSHVRFVVTDTGIGVPKEKLSTIFESFGQADASVTRKYGGTGLGLTIVRQLVKLQHGSISVKSKEDEGSSFSVIIPYEIGRLGDIADTSAQAKQSDSYRDSLKNLSVLLVEDNDINRLYASSILKSLECKLETAENGYVAIEKLKTGLFHVVLMDIQMPVMDGFEATKAIRSWDPPKSQIPIIALTANATRNDIEKCLAAGMNDCIAKPFTPEDLFRILIKHGSHKQAPVTSPQRTATTVPPPPLDLSYLTSVASGNTDFVREMITTLQESIPKSIDQIKSSAMEMEWGELAKGIHKIKPALTMMGRKDLREEAILLEDLLVNNQTASVTERILLFVQELNMVLDSLNSFPISSGS
jgi:CheY-like chemotaxis protein